MTHIWVWIFYFLQKVGTSVFPAEKCWVCLQVEVRVILKEILCQDIVGSTCERQISSFGSLLPYLMAKLRILPWSLPQRWVKTWSERCYKMNICMASLIRPMFLLYEAHDTVDKFISDSLYPCHFINKVPSIIKELFFCNILAVPWLAIWWYLYWLILPVPTSNQT